MIVYLVRSLDFRIFFEKTMFHTKLLLERARVKLSSACKSALLPGTNKKSICQQTEAPQKGLRPRQTSIWRGKSKSAGYMFVGAKFSLLLKIRGQKYHSKIYPEDLDSPRQELSNGGLRIVVTLLNRWQINFLCASRWSKSSCIASVCRQSKFFFRH